MTGITVVAIWNVDGLVVLGTEDGAYERVVLGGLGAMIWVQEFIYL